MVGMGVDGWSMTMDLQRIIAKFGRSESIASHTTRKIDEGASRVFDEGASRVGGSGSKWSQTVITGV